MIPVALQHEPNVFDAKVRQAGHKWLSDNNIGLQAAPPKASELPNYWTRSNKQLWDAYSGTCAYLAIYFEWPTGAASTDHFIAKSKHAGDAYEWNNYRLSCLGANRYKNKFDDILDPISLTANTFSLNLATGRIRPNQNLGSPAKAAAQKTITRLRLNSPENKQMRARHYDEYLRERSEHYLKRYSPFVWYEANRQGLL